MNKALRDIEEELDRIRDLSKQLMNNTHKPRQAFFLECVLSYIRNGRLPDMWTIYGKTDEVKKKIEKFFCIKLEYR